MQWKAGEPSWEKLQHHNHKLQNQAVTEYIAMYKTTDVLKMPC